jgi:penicillin-binding protein A
MSKTIRSIAWASFGVVGFLAVWLTFQQVVAGSTYSDDPRNVRAQRDADDPTRGIITTADGVVVAEDVEGVRTYPEGATYLHVVGVVSEETATGLEDTRAADLASLDDGSITSWLIGLLGGSTDAPEIRLTIVDRLQTVAANALAGHTGAAVALDPTTGAVLAYVSSPSVDPNEIIAGSLGIEEFSADTVSLDRVSFRLLPPGSIFKTLVAAVALEQGASPESLFDDQSSYLAPNAGQEIGNVTGGTCAGGGQITLREALAVSCNTVFAELAVDLGGSAIAEMTARAGFNTSLPFEFGIAIGSIPSGSRLNANAGALAQTGLGERDVRTTPMQMAIITAAMANNGVMMRPYLVSEIVSRDGTLLERTGTQRIGDLMAPAIARDLVSMMIDVVTVGTGRAAAQPGIEVAGKTGTAEGSGGPHSWFMALAPADSPTIAIVVMVEGEGTGGTTAAPIAAQMLRTWFDEG